MRNFARLTFRHDEIFARYGSPRDIGRTGASPAIYAMTIDQSQGATFQHVSCPAANASASELHIILLTKKSSAPQFAKSLVNCETPGHTRPLSAGKRRRKNYASLNLVHHCWVDRGRDREIGYARAHDDFLDNRARHHRIDHRRRGYPHVFAPDNRTISSRRPHFFHTWRNPASLRLHQTAYPFPPGSLIRRLLTHEMLLGCEP